MDDIFSELGNPGRFQICMFLLLALNLFPVVFNHVGMAFTAYSPPHICNASISPQQNVNDPFRLGYTGNSSVKYFPCKSVYDVGENRSEIRTCSRGEWVYQLEDGESTIVSEWDLVCDLAPLPNIATAIFFVGVMFGGILCGYLSDRFGRRPVILTTLYLPIGVGVGLAYVQHLETFIALRFVQGFLIQGLQTATFVFVVEWFNVNQRTTAGCLLTCFWGLGVVSIGGIAYILKDWRKIQLAISLPSILAVGYIWLIPESLRWLHARGRVKETNELIQKVAKFNKIHNLLEDKNISIWEKRQESRGKMVDIIKTPSMRKRSLLLFCVWFSCNVGYYGLTLESSHLAGNRYLNFTIASGLECIAYAIAVVVAKVFGRRRPLAFYFFLAAVCCITSGVLRTHDNPDLQRVSTGFGIAGKFAVGGMYSLLELFTTELYPTLIRNMGMGACAFCGRVGAVIAPQLITLGAYTNAQLPVIVFGALTMVGGVFTLFLPETRDANLPDTVEEVQTQYTENEVKTLMAGLEMDIEVKMPNNSEMQCAPV